MRAKLPSLLSQPNNQGGGENTKVVTCYQCCYVVDLDSLNMDLDTDPDPAFQVNLDPDTDPDLGF